MNKYIKLYDALVDGVDANDVITTAAVGDYWSIISTGESSGIAMTTDITSIAPMLLSFKGQYLNDVANSVKSWNFIEASLGDAALNCYYNTKERLSRLNAYEPFERYCTAGLDFTGKTVGIIGHMNGTREMHELAKKIYVIERSPQEGDYPDSACDFILPLCDIVLITGSSIINKTLPHLLELCENSYTILTGPSVPMCPALLDFGLDRVAGMVVRDREEMYRHSISNTPGSPYSMGIPFLLSK